MSVSNKIRIGFLVDSLRVPNRYVELIEFIRKSDKFDIPYIIYGYTDRSKIDNFQKVLRKIKIEGILGASKIPVFNLLRKIIDEVEIKLLPEEIKWYSQNSDVSSFKNIKFLKIEGVLSKSGKVLSISSDDKLKFIKTDLDLIIRCGSGILSEDFLKAAKLGILSIHGGDNRINRGVPAGFWEVFYREPSTGFIIQKLTKELDGGKVLLSGNFMTQTTWHKNRLANQKKINYFMIKILKEIAVTKKLPNSERAVFHDRILYKFDYRCFLLIKYLLKSWVPIAFKRIKFLLPYSDKNWHVAYTFANSPSKSLWKFNIIRNPANSFIADPFVVTFGGKNIIFAEEYSSVEKKGRISAIEVDKLGYNHLGPVLNEAFHLSYPFTFKHGNKVYMVPETSSINEIRIYECIEFPLKWKFKMTLMAEVDASDSMIIKKGKFWFLLTNICSVNTGDHLSELHIFYSNNFLTTNWKPLRSGNPVILNSNIARNGGLYKHEGRLFRLSQFHGFSHYGQSINVNEIKSLTINGYKEEFFQAINPKFLQHQKSVHHFFSNNILSVYDFHR